MEIQRESQDRVTVVSQSSPSEGFLTYTASREEEIIPAYQTKVINRKIVGPIYVQSPGAKMRSLVRVEVDDFSGDGTLMLIANGQIEYSPKEHRAGRVVMYHEFARDIEGSRSQLVRLEMDMAQVVYIDGTTVRMSAWITEAHFFEQGDSGVDSYGGDDIYTAVRKDDRYEEEGGEGYAANYGYPYLGPKKTHILTHKLPLRVTLTQYTGSGLGKWFRKSAGLEKSNA